MRIAFYAPLKPPDHKAPSGDRQMARLLIRALEAAGHDVRLASRLRSYDGGGDLIRQSRIRGLGGRLASRLIGQYQELPAAKRLDAWFTYHLYHKAPDWLGPAVSRALAIPYVVAEASLAPKRKNGPWAEGFAAAAKALTAADLIFCLNSSDLPCLRAAIAGRDRLVMLPPFIDAGQYEGQQKARLRLEMAASHGIDGGAPWLLAAAMMRRGDKLASYRVLGAALARLMDRPWRLLVCGDGEARREVKAALAAASGRVCWLGEIRDAGKLAAIYAACDLYVWPAVNEAYGMSFLEAQAAGLPVVAGRTGGVPDVVSDGETGVLVPVNDAAAFAAAVHGLIGDERRRLQMGKAAMERARSRHDIESASLAIDNALARFAA